MINKKTYKKTPRDQFSKIFVDSLLIAVLDWCTRRSQGILDSAKSSSKLTELLLHGAKDGTERNQNKFKFFLFIIPIRKSLLALS